MALVVSVIYLDGDQEKGTKISRAGKALVQFENGDQFEGEFGEDLNKKDGIYTWASGASYEGTYVDGGKSGQGTYVYPNGDRYVGEWESGQKHGEGTELYVNGDVFKGHYEHNMRQGEGVYTYASGAKLTGTWDKGAVVEAVWEHGSRRLSTRTVLKKLHSRLSKRFSVSSARSFAKLVQEEDAEEDNGDGPVKLKPLGVIISGAPASGKGTQCEMIRETFGLTHLSTGDMLRAAVASNSPLGQQVKSVMESGGLVSDDLVIQAVRERLDQDDVREHGFLLDGFPRTAAQAEALADLGVSVDLFLMLNVPDDALVARVTGRRIDPETGNSYHVEFNPPPEEIEDRVVQRADDTEEKVKVRLEAFHDNIGNIVTYYEPVMVEIDGLQAKEDVWTEVEAALKQARDDAEAASKKEKDAAAEATD